MSTFADEFDFDLVTDLTINDHVDDSLGPGFADDVEVQAPPVVVKQPEKPLFQLEKIEWSPSSEHGKIVVFRACNSQVVMATDRGFVIRLDLKLGNQDAVELPHREEPVHSMFLDPTGSHVIVSTAQENNYYLHCSQAKMKPIHKLRGRLESVAWDSQRGTSSDTSRILVATSRGTILEGFINEKDRHFRTAFELPDRVPITGILLQTFPADESRMFVMLTTANRYYQFIGGPTIDDLFAAYRDNLAGNELASDASAHSELHAFASPHHATVSRFAWLNGSGVFHGKFVFGHHKPRDNLISEAELYTFGKERPLSLAMTDFHVLLLYPDRYEAVSVLSHEVAHVETFQRRFAGSLRGLSRDPVTSSLWAFSDSTVWEIDVRDEDRHVWRQYLDRDDFETALKFCKTPDQSDEVLRAQADHLFTCGHFELAAKYFARTRQPLETVALQFLNVGEADALKTFVLARLNALPTEDATQRTVLATWLVELWLGKMAQLEDAKNINMLAECQENFRDFLTRYREALHPPTTYNLISSHGRMDDLLFFAKQIGEFDRVISFHLQNRDFAGALEVLNEQRSPELFYKYSPSLMAVKPFETVNAWILMRTLDPVELIPALVRYSPLPSDSENQAIRFLEYCIEKLGNMDQSVHNYLASLYAQNNMEYELLSFIKSKDRQPVFDLQYVLRVCHKLGMRHACVAVYSLMNQFEQAVELALQFDVDLAKSQTDQVEDTDLKRRLWQKIAKHVVRQSSQNGDDGIDSKAAIGILAESDLLKIEDVLPYFPDFVQINDFKDEICDCLRDYNEDIERLKTDMEVATKSADQTRKDIKELRRRSGFVSLNQRCELCDEPALSRPFYLFPCEHVFHNDCLLAEMNKHMDANEKRRVKNLQQQLKLDFVSPALTHSHEEVTVADVISEKDQLSAELDAIVAAECPMCGKVMVRQAQLEFVSLDEMDEADSWNPSKYT